MSEDLMNLSFIYYSSWLRTTYTNSPGGILVHKRGGRTTRYKVHPNQLNRPKRVEKFDHLRSEPIFPEASQTEWCKPFHKVLLAPMGAFASSI